MSCRKDFLGAETFDPHTVGIGNQRPVGAKRAYARLPEQLKCFFKAGKRSQFKKENLRQGLARALCDLAHSNIPTQGRLAQKLWTLSERRSQFYHVPAVQINSRISLHEDLHLAGAGTELIPEVGREVVDDEEMGRIQRDSWDCRSPQNRDQRSLRNLRAEKHVCEVGQGLLSGKRTYWNCRGKWEQLKSFLVCESGIEDHSLSEGATRNATHASAAADECEEDRRDPDYFLL